MLLKMQMDVEAGNRAIKDGSFGEMLERVMGEIKPEAAYFTAIDGKPEDVQKGLGEAAKNF